MSNIEYVSITSHACDRFRERFPHLLNGQNIRDRISDLITLSEENKSIFLNTRFMTQQYEKYGFNKKYHFYVYRDIIFVTFEAIDRHGRTHVVLPTILKADGTNDLSRLQRKSSSFRKR